MPSIELRYAPVCVMHPALLYATVMSPVDAHAHSSFVHYTHKHTSSSSSISLPLLLPCHPGTHTAYCPSQRDGHHGYPSHQAVRMGHMA